MQDRFRFRFWDEKVSKWFYFGFETFPTYKKQIWEALTDGKKNYQSTGLKDKNGKLIYEGDIVADVSSGCVATIEYLPSSYSLMAHIRRMDEFIPIEDICFVEKEGTPFEIIGNIYENPELLENK